MVVDGVVVMVWRKRIKNLNLAVYGADGQVRISVPLFTSEARIRQTIRARMEWIRKHQKRLSLQPMAAELQAVTGERHSLFGRGHFLEVIEGTGRHHVCLESAARIIRMHVRPGTSQVKRMQLLRDWYRLQLKMRVPELLEHWQSQVGEELHEWRIKRMKTRWGTCNIAKRRIWLNLELAKRPEECLEYILVHELVHLLEPGHSKKFYAHMDRLLPEWRYRDSLLLQEEQ